MGLGGESAGLGGSRGSALGETGRKWAILVQIPPWSGRILKEAGKRQRLQRFIDFFFLPQNKARMTAEMGLKGRSSCCVSCADSGFIFFIKKKKSFFPSWEGGERAFLGIFRLFFLLTSVVLVAFQQPPLLRGDARVGRREEGRRNNVFFWLEYVKLKDFNPARQEEPLRDPSEHGKGWGGKGPLPWGIFPLGYLFYLFWGSLMGI